MLSCGTFCSCDIVIENSNTKIPSSVDDFGTMVGSEMSVDHLNPAMQHETVDAVAKHDYTAEEDDEIDIQEGDVLELVHDTGEGWSSERIHGLNGGEFPIILYRSDAKDH